MVIFCTQGRVDVEPPSVADSLRACATASPRAWQGTADDLEDEVVEIISLGSPGSQASRCCSQNIFLRVVQAALVIRWRRFLLIYLMSPLIFLASWCIFSSSSDAREVASHK
jgi:hypothetical protein